MKRALGACICAFALTVLSTAEAWVAFKEIAQEAGVSFQHDNGAKGERRLPETLGSGCALFDYNRDGLLDIYLVNAGDFQENGAPNKLFKNQGSGAIQMFIDATEEAGVGGSGFGVGTAVGDYNGDGWEDLYVCNFRQNALYRNNGDGTFTDAAQEAGVADPRWSSAAVFFDMENDGDLDLFVVNYIDYQKELDECALDKIRVYCGPERFLPLQDALYRNNGDGTFTDISNEARILFEGRGLAAAAADYDNDGDADLFIANDMNPDFLYQNNGDGTFDEIGFIAGTALTEDAAMGNGMGVDLADFNNDGRLDLLVTNFQDQVNALYRNDPDGFFTDVSFPSEIAVPSLPKLSWGCAFADFDNDGWKDIFIANGHLHDNIAEWSESGVYAQPQLTFRNRGDGTFEDVSARSGDVSLPAVSRGAAFGDIDNDGDIDILVNNLHGQAALYRNDGGNLNGWIRVVLEPTQWAQGARVQLTAEGGTAVIDEPVGDGSYGSHSDMRLLFGVGDARRASVSVRWRDGQTSAPVETSVNRSVVIRRPAE